MFFTCIPSKEIAANFDLFEANAMLKQLMQFWRFSNGWHCEGGSFKFSKEKFNVFY